MTERHDSLGLGTSFRSVVATAVSAPPDYRLRTQQMLIGGNLYFLYIYTFTLSVWNVHDVKYIV